VEDIKVEVVSFPAKLGGPKWDKYLEQVSEFEEEQALRITGISMKEANKLRRRAYRFRKIGSRVVTEDNETVLYLYRSDLK